MTNLWYNTYINKVTSNRYCSLCNSPLIFLREETNIPSGSKFPQTNSVYVCSNDECQKEKDKQTEKRIKLQKDKEDIVQQKLDQRKRDKAALWFPHNFNITFYNSSYCVLSCM